MNRDNGNAIANLESGERLPAGIQEGLRNLNAHKNKMNFGDYREALSGLLHSGKKEVNEKHRRFLGGFILGEGSINVSLKRDRGTRFGLSLDPQFNVTQHYNQSSHLMAILDLFQTGRVYYKSGSNATLVYVMDSRQSLEEKLLPFWDKYISPYQPGEEGARWLLFKRVLAGLRGGAHRSPETFGEKLLPLWDRLRRQRGQSNQSFPDLQSAREFLHAASHANRDCEK